MMSWPPSRALPLTPAQAATELLRRRQSRATASPYAAFQRRYRQDPAGFARDCVTWPAGDGLTPYQVDILVNLVKGRRVCIRSPHGAGKTMLAAIVVLWFALTRDGGTDWKVAMTASAWRQLSLFLLPELHKWARRLNWAKVGRDAFRRDELLTLNLKLSTGEAFAVASDDPAMLEGAHATAMLYVYDEAKAIPPGIWDATEGAFSTGGSKPGAEAYALAISTPGEPNGRFYEIHSRKPGFEDWWTRHVTLDEAIAAGRISREWAEQRKRQWGEQSAVYQNRVAGEFAAGEADGVIPLAWIEAANQRWLAWAESGKKLAGAMAAVGVDVARSGEDKTVLALRYGWIITSLKRFSKEDTMATTGRVVGILDAHGGKAVVDVIGIGAGVVDRLREQGKKVVAFNAAEGTNRRDRSKELGFVNCRSAAWWAMRELLESEPVALPPDDLLTGDLTAPHWRVVSGGEIQVESKDEIRKRIGRSTDDGDAAIMAFWEQPGGWVWKG